MSDLFTGSEPEVGEPKAPVSSETVQPGIGEEPASQTEPAPEPVYLTTEEIQQLHNEGKPVDKKRLSPEHLAFYETLERDFKRHSTKTWQEAEEAKRLAAKTRADYEQAMRAAQDPKEKLFNEYMQDKFGFLSKVDATLDDLDGVMRDRYTSDEDYLKAKESRKVLLDLKRDMAHREHTATTQENAIKGFTQEIQNITTAYNADVGKDIPEFGEAKINEIREFGMKELGLQLHDFLIGDPTTLLIVQTPQGPQIRPLGDIAARITKAIHKIMVAKNPASAIKEFQREPELPPVSGGTPASVKRSAHESPYPTDPNEYYRKRMKEKFGS